MEFIFNINPIAASRPRVSKFGAYFTGPYKKFRVDAVDIVDSTLGMDWSPLEGAIHVDVAIVAKRPKTTKLEYPKADIDNYLKAIFDCLNGKLWVDDKQIIVVEASKAWSEPGEEGYFSIRINEIN